MSKEYSGENTLTYLITLIQTALKDKVPIEDIVNNLTSTDTNKPLSAAMGKALAEQIANAGGGDMLKATYDADGDGVVDDAKKLDGHEASYFATPESVAAYVSGLKGQAGGLVPLMEDSKINSIYLPSYVDDVVEGYLYDGFFYEDSAHTNLIAGERGKIYVDIGSPENTPYRYSGSAYVQVVSSDMVEISNETVQQIWDAAE